MSGHQDEKIPDNRKLAFFVEELYNVYHQEEETDNEFRTMALYYNIPVSYDP